MSDNSAFTTNRSILARVPLSLISAATILGCFLAFIQPRFESNDDVAMMFLSNGYYYGEPQEHLVYMSVVLGHFLRFLYDTLPGVPWYPILLYTVHGAALAAFLFAVDLAEAVRSPVRLVTVASALVVFHAAALMHLQFTSTGLFAAISGLMLLVSLPSSSRRLISGAVVAGLLFGVAYLIRPQTFYLAVVAGMPLFVGSRVWRHRGRMIRFSATTVAIVAIGLAGHAVTYADSDEWQAYFRFNEARGALHATPSLAQVPDRVLDDVQWSHNDLMMFRTWFFLDAEKYTTGKLQRVGEQTPRRLNPWSEVSRAIPAPYRTGALVLLVLLGLASGRRLSVPTLVAHSTWIVGILVTLALTWRLPFRVGLPLWYLLGGPWILPGQTSSLGIGHRTENVKRLVAILCACGLLLTAVHAGLRLAETSRRNEFLHARLVGILQTMHEFDPDGIYFLWGGALPLQHIAPLADGLPDLRLAPLGWQTRSPSQESALTSWGVEDPYLEIACRQDVYLVNRSPRDYWTNFYERFMHEHYGLRGQLRAVDVAPPLVIYDNLLLREQGEHDTDRVGRDGDVVSTGNVPGYCNPPDP